MREGRKGRVWGCGIEEGNGWRDREREKTKRKEVGEGREGRERERREFAIPL